MIALHSRYNPQAEAERYLSALSISPAVRCFILIEPGRGYMIPILARRFPGARIIVLHVAPPQEGEAQQEEHAVYWDPDLQIPPEDFLGRELEELSKKGKCAGGDFGPESIKIIEWRPGLDRYGDSYVKLLAAATAAVRRFDAERRTLRVFGRRWFRNFFKNLGLLRYVPVLRDLGDRPILITGAGPSLEESLPRLEELREGHDCFIIAASSSLMALLHRGIAADMVLSTDGGGWAPLHLYELFRRDRYAVFRGDRDGCLAAGLSASLPSQCACLPILGIADGSRWQCLILRGLALPHLVLPQRGTVTATALDLALALGRGKVIIAGVDLNTQDIHTHVRPYSFDRLWRDGASRFQSEYSRRFFRRAATREGGSHRIYAEWFAARLASCRDRVRSLGNNNPVFAALPPLEERELPGPRRKAPRPEAGGGRRLWEAPGGKAPGPLALEILLAALEHEAEGKTLAEELAPLLLSGDSEPRTGNLRAVVESLARPRLSGQVHG
jgi:hypothetical protein